MSEKPKRRIGPKSAGAKSLSASRLGEAGPKPLDVARWEKDGGCLHLGRGTFICARRPLRSILGKEK